MFPQVVQTLPQSEQARIDRLLPRLQTVVREVEGIGWDYDDALSETREEAFPEGG
jgi:hypothetical protein